MFCEFKKNPRRTGKKDKIDKYLIFNLKEKEQQAQEEEENNKKYNQQEGDA